MSNVAETAGGLAVTGPDAAAAATPGATRKSIPARPSWDETHRRFEERLAAAGDPLAWAGATRREAMERFRALGFPGSRNEDWRFTSLAELAATDFSLPESAGTLPAGLDPASYGLPGLGGPRLTFVNGHFASATGLDALRDRAPGLFIGCFREASGEARAALERELARHAGPDGDAFTALNTAFLEDGALIFVPRGVTLGSPVHVLSVTTAEESVAARGSAPHPLVTHGRVLVVAGEGAAVDVIEDYVSFGEGIHFSNAVTEIVAGDAAIVTHTLIERENARAYNVSMLAMRLGRSTNVTSHSLLVGGALVRNNVHPVLAGEGGQCVVNGLFMARGSQHMDNYMRVEHAAPHCDSRQFYKGVLDGRAHGVFHGRIVVHKGAQKTDAKQTNRNLLLSPEAQIDTKPQLEIYADDVKCTHGATIGQVDEEAVFYLRSRGIPEPEARAMMLLAFAGESLERIQDDAVRGALEAMVKEWFA